MMRDLFFFDVESTGTAFTDAVLEMAFLHVKLERGFYRPGMCYRRVFHYSFPPDSRFAKQNHAELYDECRYADTTTPVEVQESILEFFQAVGSLEPTNRVIVGSRLSFKLELLDRARYLLKPQILDFEAGAKEVGDYYGIIDLYGVKNFLAEVFDESSAEIQKRMKELNLECPMPSAPRHRALHDAFLYLRRMNEYRMFFGKPWEFGCEGFFEKGSGVQ